MTADEMLGKLGYVEKTKTQWGGIKYRKDDDNILYFDIESREVNKGGEADFANKYITMDELKAIYQICKEQGWLE